jgi:late competence protein required for DNA uptake (superfamily II DNA/RNA helicase)
MTAIAKSSIRPTESRLVGCSLCGELNHVVAEDSAIGSVYCSECIWPALSAEVAMRVSWKGMGVRHPRPSEFTEREDR